MKDPFYESMRPRRAIPLLIAAAQIVAALSLRGAVGAEAAVTNPPPAEAPMSFIRLLDAYAATQLRIQKLGIHTKYEWQLEGWEHPPRRVGGHRLRYLSGETWWDGSRVAVRAARWGEFSYGRHISQEDALHDLYLFDGKRVINYAWNQAKSPLGTGGINTTRDTIEYRHLKLSPDQQLFGFLFEDRDRVDRLLRRGSDLGLRREPDADGNPGNYILKARIPQGQYSVWLDPKRDYQITRAEISRKVGNDFGGLRPLPHGYQSDYSLVVTQFQQFEGLWIPMEARSDDDRKRPNGEYSRWTIHVKRTMVQLAPDFERERAFEPHDVRDGADFASNRTLGYIWQKGKLIPKPAGSRPKRSR